MRYVIFSDIHGNMMALDGMLSQTKGMDIAGYVFCGDIFGYFSHPREVIERLDDISGLYAVRGNHDAQYLDSLDDLGKRDRYVDRYGMSYLLNPSESVVGFIYSLPDMLELCLDGLKVAVAHGDLRDHLNGRIYPDTRIDTTDLYTGYDIVILGHTHYQMMRYVEDTIVLNPGSLGQPRDHKGFSYCILDTESVNPSFHTVGLDTEALITDLMEKEKDGGLVEYIRKRSEVGM